MLLEKLFCWWLKFAMYNFFRAFKSVDRWATPKVEKQNLFFLKPQGWVKIVVLKILNSLLKGLQRDFIYLKI